MRTVAEITAGAGIGPWVVAYCGGPGPHQPPTGEVGVVDGPADLRCPVCPPSPATVAAAVAEANGGTLRERAGNALAANTTYLGIASPTNAQVVAQVRLLTQGNTALIRLVINQLDATT